MRNKATIALSMAAISVMLALPAIAQSTDVQTAPSVEAQRMVPARVALEKNLDASKAAVGYQFHATLTSNIRLESGTELPHGTVLVGTVATDDSNANGTSRLALRFTQAVLKNGTIVPIKATIVGAYKPVGDSEAVERMGEQMPNNWNDGTLQVDQIGFSKDVDLHSDIADQNSGVFISTSNHDVKLPFGTEFALAIAQETPHQLAQ